MRVFILGNGAREHALTWAFSRSRCISALFVAPGNAGTAEIAVNLPMSSPPRLKRLFKPAGNIKLILFLSARKDPYL